MPDELPTPTPTPAPAKPKRTRSPINQRLVDKLAESGELAATAAQTEYTTALADEAWTPTSSPP